MNLTEKIKEFENAGWEYCDSKESGGFAYVITPRSYIFSTQYPWGKGLDACPICEQYMDDNNLMETSCMHEKEDYEEIEQAKEYLDLIMERNKIAL